MTLPELLSNPQPIQVLRGLWLLLSEELSNNALAKQEIYGKPNYFIFPVPLINNQFALSADCLTEIGPGGIFEFTFAAFDMTRFAEVEISDTLPPRLNQIEL